MNEIRQALRGLSKSPGFTITVILTLALGIGMNTAIFSMVNAVMLRPLPYRQPDRLISLWEEVSRVQPANFSSSSSPFGAKSAQRTTVSAANLADYQKLTRAFTGLSVVGGAAMNLTGEGTPERLNGQAVNYDFFQLLGVSPALGRGFLPEEDRPGTGAVVILSNELWRRRFGADPQILGRTLTLDANSYQVIGVLPPGFESPSEFKVPQHIDIYVPVALSAQQLASHGDHDFDVIGRLAPGASVEGAQQELDSVSAALTRAFPGTNLGIRAVITPLRFDLTSNMRLPLLILLGAVGLALLIACVNVANLMLVRAIARRREISVRFALGANRGRVIRDFVVESLLLAAAGCAAGLLLGSFLMEALVKIAPADTPQLESVSLDWRVFAISAALAAITGVLFGLIPAWQASQISPGESIKTNLKTMSGRSQGRSRVALIVAEVSMATVLLVGAGLLLKSFVTVMNVDLGFQPERVLAMNINLPVSHYKTPDDRLRFYQDLETRVGALPGVQSVAFANRMPLRGGWGGGTQIEGNDTGYDVDRQVVNPGYFDTLGLNLLHGRMFTPADRSGTLLVAIVNQSFARHLLPGTDPVGRRFKIGGDRPWMSIVGVVSDIRRGGKTAEITPQVYIPAAQVELYPMVRLGDFAVRTAGDPKQLVHAIQQQVSAIDKDQPITGVRTMDEIISIAVAERRFQTILVIVFAAVAVALALIGIFGVLAHSVSQRTVELGIRMALGAQRQSILAMVMKQAATWVAAGLILGVAGSLALARTIASLLFDVKPYDGLTYSLAILTLAIVSIAAAAIPARRASRVDPMVALRNE